MQQTVNVVEDVLAGDVFAGVGIAEMIEAIFGDSVAALVTAGCVRIGQEWQIFFRLSVIIKPEGKALARINCVQIRKFVHHQRREA